MSDERDNLHVISIKLPRERVRREPPPLSLRSPEKIAPPALCFPATDREIVLQAYANAVSWQAMTPYFNLEQDRSKAEIELVHHLTRLRDARDRALKIVAQPT